MADGIKTKASEVTPELVKALALQMDDIIEGADELRDLITAGQHRRANFTANRGQMLLRIGVIRDTAEHTKHALIGWP